ncbi:MAG: gamma-glutamylcyclotransferase [Actinomycetota bacterium]|nr:gamma-glutamylcyclotransferase [Rubrobacter sp.]MDQ3507384.1 gamma-glutamylcyclotransferase [Actinomycetota bacterium]
MNNATSDLTLFVYGTLKKGFPAHESFFGEDDEIEEAVVRGELFDLPAGYPALAVPQKDILAVGTANLPADTERRRGESPARRTPPAPEETVHGEIVRFGDSGRTLPMLDVFEGFDPGGESLYRRVLIAAWTASGETLSVWAYAMGSPPGKRLPDGKWPPSENQSP